MFVFSFRVLRKVCFCFQPLKGLRAVNAVVQEGGRKAEPPGFVVEEEEDDEDDSGESASGQARC